MTSRQTLADHLARARDRTLRLVDFDDDELGRQYDPLMSPLVWDLAHIGQQEELWLLRDGNPALPGMLDPAVEQLYDAFQHPRAHRVNLPLLPAAEAHRYLKTVRAKAFDALDALSGDDDGFVFALAASHENQHGETMLQALGLRTGAPLLGPGALLPAGRTGVAGTSVLVPAGPFVLGVDAADEPGSLDNERPAHVVDIPAFRIGRVPVTNAEWRVFIDDGGYRHRALWSVLGWEHRQRAGLTAPQFWNPDGSRTRFGRVEQIPDDEPVQHVTYFEAEAYAAWAGARLPTEVEWEKAARGTIDVRTWPWGNDAMSDCTRMNYDDPNIDDGTNQWCNDDVVQVGSYPTGASPYGALDMGGNVFEWVSDLYDVGYYLYSPYYDPTGPGVSRHEWGVDYDETPYYSIRGGSYRPNWYYSTVSHRHWGHHGDPRGGDDWTEDRPYFRNDQVGFRCVKDQE